MATAPKSSPLSLRRTKDDIWSYLFAALFLGDFLLGLIGLAASSWIPFIPSAAAESVGRYWMPGVVTVAFIGMVAMHRAGAGPRRLVELWRYYGGATTSGLVLICAALIFALCFLAGDAGFAKSFALIANALPSTPSRLEATIIGTHKFSHRSPATVQVDWADQSTLQTEFAYPTSRIAAMHCVGGRMVITGDSSWAGLLISQIECAAGHD